MGNYSKKNTRDLKHRLIWRRVDYKKLTMVIWISRMMMKRTTPPKRSDELMEPPLIDNQRLLPNGSLTGVNGVTPAYEMVYTKNSVYFRGM